MNLDKEGGHMNNIFYNRLIERIDKRTQNILKNVGYALGVKGFSMLVGFFTLPVYLKYFTNQSVLGVWLTLISMLSWVFTFDLGIGNGLRNELTMAFALNDKQRAKKLISSAYISSFILCFLVVILVNITLTSVDFIKLFKIQENVISRDIINVSIRILLVGVLIQFVLRLLNSILLSLHKSAMLSIINLISNLLLLLFMLIMPAQAINYNFLLISIIYSLTTNFPMIIATIIVFNKGLKDCTPSLKEFDLYEAKKIIKLGVIFLWLQIMAVIIANTNNFLISTFIGANEVVTYLIYYKLFSLVSTFFALGLTPIWSSVTDALAKQDFKWIIKLRRRLFSLIAVAAVGEIVVLLSSEFLISIWMGKKFVVLDMKMASIIAVFDLINIWSAINSNIGNGLGKLKNQFIFLTVGALINIPLALVFSRIYSSWVAIVIANIISLLPYCISETISTSLYLKKGVRSSCEHAMHDKIRSQF
jgi:O-antigen/teichoic acid export membrane protein